MRLQAPKNGAKVGPPMADLPLPPEPEEKSLRVAFSVRVTPAEHEDIQLIADVWNATDKARGVKRSRKWKPSSVVARLITGGIDNFFDGVKLPRPTTEKERDAFIRRCVDLFVGGAGESPRKK